MGGYGLSQMESHGAVCLSVGRSVGRSVVISRKAVSQKGKKRMYSGKSVMRKMEVRRKEAEGFHKYRKNAKTLGVIQSTPPHYKP